jgi:hypothetical protein
MFQEKQCPTIHHHHHLDQHHYHLLRHQFQLKMLPQIMIHFFQHLIKILLQVILLQLEYHIHSIPMQHHPIFPVKPELIPIIFLNKPINQQIQIIQPQHQLPIHGINHHIVPIRDLPVGINFALYSKIFDDQFL